jgi:signal transduction histidine kinase
METKKNYQEYLRILKHDLKGPLTVIKGYLSFWESDTYLKFPPEKQKEFILKALEGTKKLETAIEETFERLLALEKEGKLKNS